MIEFLAPAGFFGLGFIVGAFFFLSLRQSVRIILSGGRIGHVCLLYLARFLAAGLVFFLAARAGAADLIAAALGFTAARFAPFFLRERL